MRSPPSRSRFVRLAGPLVVLAIAWLVLVTACSSNPPAGSGPSDGGDQALGTACDPSLPMPCETLTDVCSVAVCDPASHRCVRVAVDAGPICGTPPPPCAECDGGDDAGDAADASFDGGEASLPDASADADAAADGALDASDAAVESDAPAGD